MKILFILHFPNPFPGAAWSRISFFAEHFRRNGHAVSIAGVFSPKSFDKRGIRKWNEIKLFNVTPILMTNNIFSLVLNNIFSFLSSATLIAYLRPEKVVISVPIGDSVLGCYLAIRMFRKEIVFDYRDQWEDYAIGTSKSAIDNRSYKLLKRLMTKCYINSSHVVTNTDAFAADLSSRGIKNVKMMMNGADTNVFKPYDKIESRKKIGFDKHDFIILYSGGIGAYYKLDIVIKAIERLSNKIQKLKLIMVGEGPELENILNLAKSLNISERIYYFPSKTNRTELAELLSTADAGVIPYDANPLWKNSLPAKIFEYLACGVPVVATTFTDSMLGKLITENKIGLISEPENVIALADSIEMLYNDQSFRNSAATNARPLIEKHFDRNKIATQFLNLLTNE